jgi:hypothetical protein
MFSLVFEVGIKGESSHEQLTKMLDSSLVWGMDISPLDMD